MRIRFEDRDIEPREFFEECSTTEAQEMLDICLDGLQRSYVFRIVIDWIQLNNMVIEAIDDLGGITKE